MESGLRQREREKDWARKREADGNKIARKGENAEETKEVGERERERLRKEDREK